MEAKKKTSKIETKVVKKEVKTVKAVKVAKAVKPVKEVKSVKVQVKAIPESALKLRLVADLVRGKNVEKAIAEMDFVLKKGALFIKKALKSAAASAQTLYGADKSQLYVSHISVDEGHPMRKFRIASRSRVAALSKRRSIINLIVTVK